MIETLYRILVGFGYTDPLHAPVTHMPIGLVVGGFVFFVVALIFKRKNLIMTARHVSILALIFAFPTILFGVFDWIHFYHGVLMPAIKIKMALAGSLLVVLGLGIILGSEVKLRSLAMGLLYGLGVVLVVGLGWFGGGIVYGRSSAIGAAPAPAVSGPAPSAGSAAGAAGNAQSGQAIFAANCQACHAGGANVIVSSLPIKGSKRLARLDTFVAFLRAPTMPDGSEGSMPPFGKDVVGDAQAKDLYAYVTTAWK
jgi:mono/diheme cytochrome c family protein